MFPKVDKQKMKKFTENVMEKYNLNEKEAEDYILNFGPKRLSKLGILDDKYSWRAGFTKQTIEKRKSNNRKKNKIAKMSRRKNR